MCGTDHTMSVSVWLLSENYWLVFHKWVCLLKRVCLNVVSVHLSCVTKDPKMY